MKNSEFLLELYSEEIPSFLQNKYAQIIAKSFEDFFNDKGVNHSDILSYSGPCRIVIYIESIDSFIPEKETLIKGPKANAPDIAIEGFCKANSINKSDLIKQNINKIDYYFAKILLKQTSIKQVLEENIPQILSKIVWPKSMYWGNHNISWIRPLKNILCLLDSEIVKFNFGHLESNNLTTGHKFLRPSSNPMSSYSEYKKYLENNFVILDQVERKRIIKETLQKLANDKNLDIVPDERLLEEVTGLVEWPKVLIGSIEKDFLKIPHEILSTAIRIHQKYFSLRDKDGKFSPYFAFVCNIPENHSEVIKGNEKVLRARLNDAVFFYNQDLKDSLESRLEKLKTVSFHKGAGSIYDKVHRLQKICKEVVSQNEGIGGYTKDIQTMTLERAALLCKSDLVSEVVTEFPNLQGIMGYYYALNDKENEKVALEISSKHPYLAPEDVDNNDVARAIRDHYMPIGFDGKLPETLEGKILSLADKFDNLVMLYLAGERATGSKDPMALRRTAIAIIRVIVEGGIRVDIKRTLECIYEDVLERTDSNNQIITEILDFIKARLMEYLEKTEEKKYLDAVMNPKIPTDLKIILSMLSPIIKFLKSEEGINALYVYNRASSIIGDGITDYDRESVEEDILIEMEEKNLYKYIKAIQDKNQNLKKHIEELKAAEKQVYSSYSLETLYIEESIKILEDLAELKYSLDAFFDHVLVNTDNPDITLNRKNLLRMITKLFDQYADFSKLRNS